MTSETEEAPPSPSAPLPAGSRTGDSPHEPRSRPWELELLISGAVAFALLQLPGAVDAWYDGVSPHVAGAAQSLAWMVYYYTKLILYTLIASLLMHLAARAFWVGLIGLESVYPGGVRWDQAGTVGPITRRVYQERLPPIQAAIDRTDRFCSVIFSAAFAIVLLFAFSILGLFVLAGAAFALARLVFGEGAYENVLLGLVVLLVLPSTVLYVLDKRLGERLDPGSRAARLLRAGATVYYYALLMPFYGVIYMTLSSNLRKRTFLVAYQLVLAALFGLVLVRDALVRRGFVSADSYAYLPDEPGGRGLSPDHYDNLRPRSAGAVPLARASIQADVVRDPYVKLFVPYVPGVHDRVFAERCPGLAPLDETGLVVSRPGADRPRPDAQVDAVLRCWTGVQRVTLNGRPLAPAWRFYTHPATGRRGVVAYLPTAPLPRGENLLVVEQLPDRRGRPRVPDYIPFWL